MDWQRSPLIEMEFLEFWKMIKPFVPHYHKSPRGGRPRVPMIRVAEAIYLVLISGGQWKIVPRCLCAASTAHSYFQQWAKAGVFEKLWREMLWVYDEKIGLKTDFLSVDGSMAKAPLGQENTGSNPTDRGKRGVKRSILTDANGIPIGLAIAGANVHDSQLLQLTIDDAMETLCWAGKPRGDHLCLDKAYDSNPIRESLEEQGFKAHIRSRGEEIEAKSKGHPPRRWVVERTFSWLNRYRRLLIRWEKTTVNYIGMIHLAFAHIISRKSTVFG